MKASHVPAAVLDRQVDRLQSRRPRVRRSHRHLEEVVAHTAGVCKVLQRRQGLSHSKANMRLLHYLRVKDWHDSLATVVALEAEVEVGDVARQVREELGHGDVALGLWFAIRALPLDQTWQRV